MRTTGGAPARVRLLPCRAMSPLLAAIALWGTAAHAQDEGLRLRVAVDDRSAQRLQEPVLVVDQEGVGPVPFRDDGQISGDVPGDRIFVAAATVARGESVRLGVAESGAEPLGMVQVSLPAEGSADVALKVVAGEPALVLDSRAPAMPAEAVADPGSRRLVVTAAPTGDAVEAGDEGADRITVRFLVDDRAADRIDGAARLTVDQEGVAPAPLVDDGETAQDEDGGDDIFAAELSVFRAQYLGFAIEVDGEALGELSVFLPSTSEALVRVRTAEGEAGLELLTEPTALGSADAPAAGGPSGASPAVGSGGGGGDRFVHVLWILIGMAAVGFTWLRRVVARTWTEELRPVIHKLDRYLSRELGEPVHTPPGAGEPGPPGDAP